MTYSEAATYSEKISRDFVISELNNLNKQINDLRSKESELLQALSSQWTVIRYENLWISDSILLWMEIISHLIRLLFDEGEEKSSTWRFLRKDLDDGDWKAGNRGYVEARFKLICFSTSCVFSLSINFMRAGLLEFLATRFQLQSSHFLWLKPIKLPTTISFLLRILPKWLVSRYIQGILQVLRWALRLVLILFFLSQ